MLWYINYFFPENPTEIQKNYTLTTINPNVEYKTDLEKALTLDVDLGGTHLYLGLIHKKNGNVAEAKKELQMAINLIHPIRETEELLIAESALANLGR